MIITVDTGGTKTLVASFDEEKNPKHIIKFPTPKNVDQYIQRVANQIHLITNDKPIDAISVALPGVLSPVLEDQAQFEGVIEFGF